jgi:lysophospholipase L1-like esterase
MVQPASKRLVTEATVDAKVSEAVSTGGSSTRSALDTRYAIKGEAGSSGATFTLLGDSITRQCDGQPYFTYLRSTGYIAWAQVFLDARLEVVRNGGVAGERSDQILARTDTELSTASEWAFVLAGANDVTQDVPASTITTNLAAIYAKVIASGRRLAVATIMPTTSASTTGRKSALMAVNAWIRDTALASGYPCADFYSAIVDPSTGYPISNATSDGTHPQTEGAIKLGSVLADSLAPYLPALPFPSTATSAGNLLTNGAMLGSSSGKATGWATAGTATPTAYKVARASLPGFEWQVLDFSASSSGTLTFYVVTAAASVAAGDILEGYMEFECEGIGGAGFLDLVLNVRDSGGAGLASSNAAIPSGVGTSVFPAGGVLRTGKVTAPAGADNVMIYASLPDISGGRVKLGRAHVRKVN